VLLVRSSDGMHWLFPKGHIEAGERGWGGRGRPS